MPILYAYVDGSDLESVVAEFLAGFEQFAATWSYGSIKVVNDRQEPTPDLGSEDLPDWNLGLNLEFESLPPNAFEKLLAFLSQLASSSGRAFVIGEWNAEWQTTEDLVFVGAQTRPRNLEFLIGRYSM